MGHPARVSGQDIIKSRLLHNCRNLEHWNSAVSVVVSDCSVRKNTYRVPRLLDVNTKTESLSKLNTWEHLLHDRELVLVASTST